MQSYFTQLLNYNIQLLNALIIFILTNYITSIFVAIVEKKWLMDKLGLKNIFGKIGILLLIYISHIIGVIIVNNAALSNIVTIFYLSKEGSTILNNLARLGVPLPPIIVKIIGQLNRDDNDN